MPLYTDVDHKIDGLTGEAMTQAPARDVQYLSYWYDDKHGKVLCLVHARSPEAAEAVHREAHGLLVHEVSEVQQGV
jgi:hypothetical protein